ncbi:MAG TPA: hypothetical protein VFD58_25830 [Blastocatellia bacterium]|nr:hypothetical protein [Blastocatellia bacterium]
MTLSPEETERYYRIWWAALRHVNEQLHLVDDLPAAPEVGSLPPDKAATLRGALWADEALLESFLAENPAALTSDDLALAAGWRHRVAGRFFILRHLKKYSIFLDEGDPARAYGVLGLVSPIAEVIPPYLPMLVEAVLLPYEDRIIYDSLLAPYNIHFGKGYRESLNLAFRDAREREGIITSLGIQKGIADSASDRESLRARNERLLGEFQKALYKSGLSPKVVGQHADNLATFARWLLEQTPPRLLLDFRVIDLEDFITGARISPREEKAFITSLKRFARFLYDSMRMHPDTYWDLQDYLKVQRRGPRL